MKITIKSADNGYIVRSEYVGESTVDVVEANLTSEAKTMRDLLYVIQEALGYYTSKHSSENLYLVIGPGTSSDEFTEAHSQIIFGE